MSRSKPIPIIIIIALTLFLMQKSGPFNRLVQQIREWDDPGADIDDLDVTVPAVDSPLNTGDFSASEFTIPELDSPISVPGEELTDGSTEDSADNGSGEEPTEQTLDLAALDPTARSMQPITDDAERAQAHALIETVSTAGRGPKTGYDREQFGSSWSDACDPGLLFCRNGLDTRNDILSRDLTNIECKSPPTAKSDPHCAVATGTLDVDPFTGHLMSFERSCCASEIQIDHLLSLSAAWQMGAAHWDDETRLVFANDPLNLLAVDGSSNQSKSDSTPASWLPPNKPIRCAFSVRYAAVSIRYGLPVTEADKAIMLDQCAPRG